MKISIAAQASAHLESAYQHLEAIDKKLAASQLKRIFEGIDHLKQFPESAPIGRKQGTRELTIPRTPFMVVYSIEGDTINVLAVLHGAQRWPR